MEDTSVGYDLWPWLSNNPPHAGQLFHVALAKSLSGQISHGHDIFTRCQCSDVHKSLENTLDHTNWVEKWCYSMDPKTQPYSLQMFTDVQISTIVQWSVPVLFQRLLWMSADSGCDCKEKHRTVDSPLFFCQTFSASLPTETSYHQQTNFPWTKAAAAWSFHRRCCAPSSAAELCWPRQKNDELI